MMAKHKVLDKTSQRTLSLIACLALMISACDNQTSTSQTNDSSTKTTTQQSNQPNYLVATISSFPPFILRDRHGKPTGFDVDILNAVGREEGFTVTFLPQPWQTALPSLNDGSRDIVATGVVITPERQEIYDFSDPYLDTGWIAVLKKTADKPRYQSFAEMRMQPNLVYVTQGGAAGVGQLNSFLTPEEQANLKTVDTQYQEIKAVMAGEADVAFDISRVLQYYVSRSPNGELYGIEQPGVSRDYFGFVVKKGRNDLRQSINRGLAKIRENGTYDQILQKWYGPQN